MSGTKLGRGHTDWDGCLYPAEGHLVHTCDAPCSYGGMENTKRRSGHRNLGHMGFCNNRVPAYGMRCHLHRQPSGVPVDVIPGKDD